MDTESDIEKKREWITTKKFFSEAVLVAGVTAIGYLSACAYQLAYLNYFGIPTIFLSVDLSSVLFIVLIGMVYIFENIMVLVFLINSDFFSEKYKRFLVLIVLFIQVFLPLLIVIIDPTHPIRTLIAISFVIISFFFFVVRKKRNSYRDAVKKILDTAEQSWGTLPVMVFLSALLFIFYGFVFGSVMAKANKDFLIPATDPNVAIISTYGGNFVGLTFSTTTHQFGEEIKLISQENISTSSVFNIETLDNIYPHASPLWWEWWVTRSNS
jgi:hypothetical protein